MSTAATAGPDAAEVWKAQAWHEAVAVRRHELEGDKKACRMILPGGQRPERFWRVRRQTAAESC